MNLPSSVAAGAKPAERCPRFSEPVPRLRRATLRMDYLPYYGARYWVSRGCLLSQIVLDSELLVDKGFLALARPLYVQQIITLKITTADHIVEKSSGSLSSNVFAWFVVLCALWPETGDDKRGWAWLGWILQLHPLATSSSTGCERVTSTSPFRLRQLHRLLIPTQTGDDAVPFQSREVKYLYNRHNGHRSLV